MCFGFSLFEQTDQLGLSTVFADLFFLFVCIEKMYSIMCIMVNLWLKKAHVILYCILDVKCNEIQKKCF